MRRNLPSKLEPDCILEAVFEARFEYQTSSVSEVLIGRLADAPQWRGFRQRRLPTADIPAAIRRADENLRFQPSIELRGVEDKSKIVRIGPQSLLYSRRSPYPGWTSFGKEIADTIDSLFSIEPTVAVVRLGLRYINVLRSDLHNISGIESLNMAITVDQDPLKDRLNLNYTIADQDTTSAVRIATREIASGSIPENTTVIIDIDVSTNPGYRSQDPADTKRWIEIAHDTEKTAFFRLLKDETINRLRKD